MIYDVEQGYVGAYGWYPTAIYLALHDVVIFIVKAPGESLQEFSVELKIRLQVHSISAKPNLKY